MTTSTTGKMSLLAAASLMAVTVGMAAPAQAADTTTPGANSGCPKNAQGESSYVKVRDDSSVQIKGQSKQYKEQFIRSSNQIKADCTQIKGDATHIKLTTGSQNTAAPSHTVVSPRDPASGLPTGK